MYNVNKWKRIRLLFTISLRSLAVTVSPCHWVLNRCPVIFSDSRTEPVWYDDSRTAITAACRDCGGKTAGECQNGILNKPCVNPEQSSKGCTDIRVTRWRQILSETVNQCEWWCITVVLVKLATVFGEKVLHFKAGSYEALFFSLRDNRQLR